MIRYKVTTRSNIPQFSAAVESIAPTVTKQWASRWMTYIRRRFDRNSKGGGDWAPLKQSTIDRRRYSKGGRIGPARRSAAQGYSEASRARIAAQRAMNAATTPKERKAARAAFVRAGKKLSSAKAKRDRVKAAGESAAILRDTGTLFRATSEGAPGNLFAPSGVKGFRAGFMPTKHPSGKPTLSQIAAWHNKGAPGKYPARPILVPPDQVLGQQMMGDLDRALTRAGASSSLGRGRGKR